jgi:hypothetical protein
MLVHDPVSSAVQAASIEPPSLITVDPSGVVGVTIAETRGRRANRIEASILYVYIFVEFQSSVGVVVGMNECVVYIVVIEKGSYVE